MGFIMDGLDAEGYDRSYNDRELLRRIVAYFGPHRRVMLGVAGVIFLNAVMTTALPILIGRMIDTLDAGADLSRTRWLLLAFLLFGALSWLFNYLRQWHTARVVGNIVLKLRQDAFAAVVARDMSFYDEFSSGKIVSRVTSDTQAFASVVTLTLNLMSELLIVVIVVAVLLSLNVRLTLLALAISPLVIVAALSFRHIARQTTLRAQRALANVNSNVQETVTGIAVAKNFRQEQNIYDAFTGINQQSYGVSLRQGMTFSAIFPVLVLIAGTGTTIIVYLGGQSVLNGVVSAGEWFLFVEAVNLFWFPLTSIASFWSQFQQGLSASERVFALIDAEPRVVQTDNQPVPPLRGQIAFMDVDFHYAPREPVLSGFNLTIGAGETVALVGHTGAGKSSLGKLVARFYEFQGGQLLIDGRDIRTFDLRDYRRQLGVVPQTPFLFAGTIRDNIRYGRPDASDEEVLTVAQQIGWGDWLRALPQGLETEVGEEGRALSMGQRQLVALARVMLQDPAIIILDEATASVDPLAEAQIQESLEVILRQRTAVIIAHRLSTIENADRIIVLRQGEIIEEGTHDQLMRLGGHYADLYDTYFRHQSPDYEVPISA
ncbi:MAG: ABC transporter ATP-binding protein [Anaerolineales bacterium]|nr:ABC transporter ATP-binding protein [Anaerolineales bacterium]MCB8950575.1 ABC transporter ATP-binding protein [Ardenticatenales bacterium]